MPVKGINFTVLQLVGAFASRINGIKGFWILIIDFICLLLLEFGNGDNANRHHQPGDSLTPVVLSYSSHVQVMSTNFDIICRFHFRSPHRHLSRYLARRSVIFDIAKGSRRGIKSSSHSGTTNMAASQLLSRIPCHTGT